MEKINENWTEPVGDEINVPDILMPLFNKVGIQIRFHTISGKNEILTIAHIVENARIFFRDNPDALGIESNAPAPYTHPVLTATPPAEGNFRTETGQPITETQL